MEERIYCCRPPFWGSVSHFYAACVAKCRNPKRPHGIAQLATMESYNAFWRSYQEATPGGRIGRRGTFLLRGTSPAERRRGCFQKKLPWKREREKGRKAVAVEIVGGGSPAEERILLRGAAVRIFFEGRAFGLVVQGRSLGCYGKKAQRRLAERREESFHRGSRQRREESFRGRFEVSVMRGFFFREGNT